MGKRWWGSYLMTVVTVSLLWVTGFVSKAGSQPAPEAVLMGVPAVSPPDAELESARTMLQQDAQAQAHWQLMYEAEQALLADELAQRNAIRLEQEHRDAQRNLISDLAPPEYQRMVLNASERFEVDPRLIASVIRVESVWNPQLLGRHGDTGLMQILPNTGRWIAERMGMADYDLWDPETNVAMGTWYLATLYQEYGSWEMALAAYNGGPSHAHQGASHPYTMRVMAIYGN